MAVFTKMEMVTMFRQAADKNNQIKVFCQTEGLSENAVKELLIENGIKPEEFPVEKPDKRTKKYRNQEKTIKKETTSQEEQEKKMVHELIGYIFQLQAEREALLDRIEDINKTLEEIKNAVMMGNNAEYGENNY